MAQVVSVSGSSSPSLFGQGLNLPPPHFRLKNRIFGLFRIVGESEVERVIDLTTIGQRNRLAHAHGSQGSLSVDVGPEPHPLAIGKLSVSSWSPGEYSSSVGGKHVCELAALGFFFSRKAE